MKKYRLKDEKYRKPAQEIAGFAEGGSLPLEHFISNENGYMRKRLEEYGVFDLWFEEVPKYKAGDYISVLHSREVYEIEECKVIGDKLHWNTVGVDRMGYGYRFSTPLENIRILTAEEIEEYKKQLPTINGYRGKRIFDYIVYGCKSIHIQDFRRMYKACLCMDLVVDSITIEGQEVPMETLQEIYEKTY